MRVKGDATSNLGSSVVYRNASYMACGDCGESAMVWDEKENKPGCCGNVYGGRP